MEQTKLVRMANQIAANLDYGPDKTKSVAAVVDHLRRFWSPLMLDEVTQYMATGDAEQRGIEHGDWVGLKSRAGDTVLRADITERVQPGVVYTTFHHPESGANVVTTDNSDWATNCPEYKVTAVQAHKVTQLSKWQEEFQQFTEEQLEHLRQAKLPTRVTST